MKKWVNLVVMSLRRGRVFIKMGPSWHGQVGEGLSCPLFRLSNEYHFYQLFCEFRALSFLMLGRYCAYKAVDLSDKIITVPRFCISIDIYIFITFLLF